MKEQIDFCFDENSAKLFAKLICTAPVMFPFIFSFYMQIINEQRLFLWGENNGKQQ
jgi:hypothetical protein